MKVDIVVAYYQPLHWQWWEHLRKGFEKNSSLINRVIVVNDGLWSEGLLQPDSRGAFELVRLSHEQKGFGLSRSLNQGMAEAQTEHVLIMEGDEILAPKSLEFTLPHASPNTLLCCGKVYLDPNRIDKEYCAIEGDHRWLSRAKPLRDWWYASGGHLLTHKPTHEELGGFNENYGYGLHDFDYAARWMKAKGDHSVFYDKGLGYVWHIGSGKGRTMPSPEAYRIFTKTLADLYGHRYHLACGNKFDNTCVNVDIAACAGADVYMNCKDLGWIPDSTASYIFHSHFIEHMPRKEAIAHLEDAYRALAPEGQLIIECPDIFKCCRAYLEGKKGEVLQALFSDEEKQTREGWGHYYGWDTDTLSEVLREIGFEIDYLGDSFSETCRWRDLRIEAAKPEK